MVKKKLLRQKVSATFRDGSHLRLKVSLLNRNGDSFNRVSEPSLM